MKLKEILFLIVVFIFFSFPFVMGDGGYFPDDRQIHLYEPNQKTVVLWDRLKETIILSSSVKSDNIANFAWVIPIQSSSKPIVSAGNISIFEELVDYFTPEISYRKGCGIGEGGCAGGGGGVEVIESKEIDIYDITILKANNSNDLINWLNDNGYKFPENVIYYNVYSILDKCVNKYNCYFIANKIDLRNKHKDALDFIDEFVYSRLRKEELENWINTLDIAY